MTGFFLRIVFLISLGLFFGSLMTEVAWAEDQKVIEQSLAQAEDRLVLFDQGLTLRERKALRQTSVRDRDRLEGALRKKFDEREVIKEEVETLRLMADLKSKLLALPVGENSEIFLREREKEADAIARMAVLAFDELRRQYEMIRPALLHNLLVNMGLREEGLCWHWARDLRKRLRGMGLKTFDIYWSTAREGTMREHNTVVLVSRGRPFSEGLFLDGWKHAGRPFWMRVADDKKHPWVPGACAVCDQAEKSEGR